MSAEIFINVGFIGLITGILLAMFVVYRRIRWTIRLMQRKKAGSPKLLKGLRNFVLLLLWISVFGLLLFGGFFFRAYHAFTFEEPVAEVRVEPTTSEQTSRVTLLQFLEPDSQVTYQFLIRGDQWMLEGDMLKWDNWLSFLGWRNRYRLTRIRGRFIDTQQELSQPPTIYSLVQNEDDLLWKFLYKYGPELPFVNTVYGSAVFQTSDEIKSFRISISPSGFISREVKGTD